MSAAGPDQSPAIAIAIIVEDGRVLMVRRRVAEGELSWQFPAGQVEPGETSEAAAVREGLEEVGLALAAKSVLGQRVHPALGRQMVYVACDVIGGEARVGDDDELDAYEWCSRQAVSDHVPSPLFGPVEAYLAEVLDE